MADTVHIAIIQAHKVKTGETLDGIAKEHGMSWQQLAKFNWGTSTPKEIDGFLRSEVGCTKKTKDGKNYQFDNSDDPGLVFVPKKWTQGGLSTDQVHTIRVRTWRRLIIQLEDDAGHPIPETGYRVVFEDGSERTGSLGRGGAAAIVDPPAGPFAVYYPDHDDILAKSLAATARDAFGQEDSANVFCLLQYPPEAIQAAIDAYAKYFNDYSGKGLVADIHQTITDPDVLPLVKAMLAYTGIEESAEVKIIQRLELDNQVQGDA